jgi:hypothetical protein
MYPIEKYDIKQYDRKNDDGSVTKVIMALSTYGGKIVKGVAKCQPSDNYDFECGKKLAAAICDYKVCVSRNKRAQKKLAAALNKLQEMEIYVDKMTKYAHDSVDEVSKSLERLNNIEKLLK